MLECYLNSVLLSRPKREFLLRLSSRRSAIKTQSNAEMGFCLANKRKLNKSKIKISIFLWYFHKPTLENYGKHLKTRSNSHHHIAQYQAIESDPSWLRVEMILGRNIWLCSWSNLSNKLVKNKTWKYGYGLIQLFLLIVIVDWLSLYQILALSATLKKNQKRNL